MKWQIEQTDTTVHVLRAHAAAGERLRVLLMSDVHFDSRFCDRDKLKEHLERAQSVGALVCIFGDLFDAMQGRADPRRSMEELRDEYKRDDYYDFLARDAAEWLAPYAKNIALIGYGNHETSVVRYRNTDPLQNLVYLLRNEHHSPVVAGGYAGWLLVRLVDSKGRAATRTLNIRYAHSAGGGNAPVTRGVIQANRQAVYLPDADVIVNGHNHEGYIVPIARERVTTRGRVVADVAWGVRTPGYKRAFTGRRSGFDVERGSPKPVGSILLEIWHEGGGGRHGRLRTSLTPWIE